MTSPRSPEQLQNDALEIWQAGVQAVQGHRLLQNQLHLDGHYLCLPDHDLHWDLTQFDRIVVLGGGKAGRAMAFGLEQVLAPLLGKWPLMGQLNIPQESAADHSTSDWNHWQDLRATLQFHPDDYPTQWIDLQAVRPPGQNRATALAVKQTDTQLQWASGLTPRDLCLVLLSGGGSALLTAPVPELDWQTINQVTDFLSSRAIAIDQMNQVRTALSRIKGGGLLRHLNAGQVVTLVISDVLGDPPATIASGPTHVQEDQDPRTLRQNALKILKDCDPFGKDLPESVFRYLASDLGNQRQTRSLPPHRYCVLGNLAVAVDAAGVEAERRGYSHVMHTQAPGPSHPDGGPPTAEQEGTHLARMLVRMQGQSGPDCLITGGEPVVDLTHAAAGARGGRNQQLALAAASYPIDSSTEFWSRCCLVSGGTDGEDGPTTAAGACLSPLTLESSRHLEDARQALKDCDSHRFFARHGGLLLTGPTGTNVCDLRVGVVSRRQPQPTCGPDGGRPAID